MKEQFNCSHCKKRFDLKDRGYFSYSQGEVCKGCSSKESNAREEENKREKIKFTEEERMRKIRAEKDFEDKVRKIINKVLEEREHNERIAESSDDKKDDKFAKEYIKKQEAENKKYPTVFKY